LSGAEHALIVPSAAKRFCVQKPLCTMIFGCQDCDQCSPGRTLVLA
jgi:hypothetical protein